MTRQLLDMMWLILSINVVLAGHTLTDKPTSEQPLIGYTELQTNLPGGRHANVRTMRASVVRADGSGHARIADELADQTDAWTQFAGWSPDGKQAIVSRGWQDAENANWEQEHKTFRMEPKKWLLDSCLVNIATGKVSNLTAVDRVSHNALSSYPVRGRQAVALWFETQWCPATVRDDPRRSWRDSTHPSQDRLRSHVAALATG